MILIDPKCKEMQIDQLLFFTFSNEKRQKKCSDTNIFLIFQLQKNTLKMKKIFLIFI